MSSENPKNGEEKTLTDDECFKEYKREYLLKNHIAVNIEMVKQKIRSKEEAFDAIQRHYERAEFK